MAFPVNGMPLALLAPRLVSQEHFRAIVFQKVR